MAPKKLKRSPDAAVSMTVAQIVKQQKSKRMMMFGLRNLSEMCSPDKNKYKENSIAALSEEIVPVISSNVQAYGDDEDVVMASVKILKGISDYLIEEPDPEFISKLQADGGVTAGLHVLSNCCSTMDEQILLTTLDYFSNLEKLGIRPDIKVFAGALIQAIGEKKLAASNNKIFKAIAHLCDNSEVIQLLAESDAVTKILNVLTRITPSVADAAQAAESGLLVIQKVVHAAKPPSSITDGVIKTLDLFKGKKSVVDRGSAILAAMVSPEELRRCLDALATASHGSRERQDALTTLISMSYIASYADAIVQAGGIQLLCSATQASANDLNPDAPDPLLVKGLTGACKMLGKIAENPSNVAAIIDADGLPAITNALVATQRMPATASVCLETLTPLLRKENNAQDFHLLNGYQTTLSILQKNIKNNDVANAGFNLLSAALSHDPTVGTLYDMDVVSVLNTGLELHQDDLAYQTNTVYCLTRTSKMMTSFKEASKGHKALVAILQGSGGKHAAFVFASLQFLERIASLPDALEPLQQGETADAVLNIMLSHPDDANIQFIGKSLLETIATEVDVKRCLANLDRSIQNAKSNPASAYRSLAAVNGLSQVTRLRDFFEQKEASATIQKGISLWIQTPPFPEQQRIIKAAATSIESLKLGSNVSPHTTIVALLTTSLLPQLRSLSEKQDVNDTNLLDLVRCCRNLCTSATTQQTAPIPDDRIPEILEAVTKVSWRYQDLRKVQVLCIDMMTELATAGTGEGVSLLSESGTLKNVISYMLKVVIYEDVQAAGLQLLGACLKQNPALVEPIKFAGGIEVCKSIQSTHSSSAQIKTLLPPVANALMPSDFLDKDIKAAIETLNVAIMDDQLARATVLISSLGGLVSSPEGARSAANNRISVPLQRVVNIMPHASGPDRVEFAIEVSKLMQQLCQSRAGLNHLSRCGGQSLLLTFLDVLADPALPDTPAKKEGIEANLYAFRALSKTRKGAPVSQDIAAMRRQVATFCMLVETYPEETRIGGAAAAALSALPTAALTSTGEFTQLIHGLVDKLNIADAPVRAAAAAAMAQLFDTIDEERCKLIEKNGAIDALFKTLDEHGHDSSVRVPAVQALLQISKQRSLRKYITDAQGGEAALEKHIKMLHRLLDQHCKDDAESAESIVQLLNRLTRSSDRKLLTDLGFIDLAAELMQQYPDQKGLTNALGELLGKTGAGDVIDVLINQIIATTKDKPEGWKRSLELLCGKLAVVIPANVDNVEKAFANVGVMCDALAPVLENSADDAPLADAISLVSRRLVDRFEVTGVTKDQQSLPFGTKAVAGKLVSAIAHVLAAEGSKANQNKSFVMNAYHTLAVTARDTSTHMRVVDASSATNLVAVSYTKLSIHQNDPDVVLRILEYLAAMSSSNNGLDILLKQFSHKPGQGTPEEQLATHILSILKRHKSNGLLVASGEQIIQALALRDPSILTSKFTKDLGTIAEETPEGLTALMRLYAKLLAAGITEPLHDEMSKIEERFRRIYDNPNTTIEQKRLLAAAYAELMQGLAETDDIDTLKRSSVVETLVSLLEEHAENPEVLLPVISALKQLADLDADFNAMIARNAPSILTGACAPTVKADPLLCRATLHLLYSLGCNEGNGKLLSTTVGFDSLMTAIEMSCSKFDPKEADDMQKLLSSFKYMVEQDNPQALTLKQVYERWNARKTAGDTLEISESVVVMQQLDFVCDYTEEYSKEPLKGLDAELGSEFRYGCLCFSLLHEYPLNTGQCVERGEGGILVRALKNQKAQDIIQCAVVAARDLCAHPEGAIHFGGLPDSKAVTERVVSSLPRGANAATPEEADEIMIPRLELIERCALARTHYNDTTCMQTLISVWDDCDAKLYTEETLRHVFRAMRRIVNESWVETILGNQVPKRLIAVVSNPSQNLTLLPDVLFLLGALATVQEIKTLVGELRGVEACLDLLTRCLKNTADDTTAVQTNACLALANITIGHGPNIAQFTAARGIEINIEVMERSMEVTQYYDVANAASVLMCNLCYRRDDIKKLFGNKGGPKTVTETIRKYDGSDSRSAFRCLGSMFKAIGNLALYTPNVTTFLEEGVEKTFAHLYLNSEFIPDELLEVSLRTMSNLVLENTDEFMEKFGVVLLPILTMLQQTRRESVRMLSLAFDVMGNLCRLPTNARAFVDANGIETTLRIVNTHSDARLSATTIHLLGMQTNNPDCLERLINAGVFKFLANLFESQAAAEERQPEVCVAGLRCVRRLLLDQSAATAFINVQGPAAILRLMNSCPEVSMVQLDGYRNILSLLDLFPPPEPPKPEGGADGAEDSAEWDADVADEGVLTLIHRMERPPSPRSWEAIGLDGEMVRQLVVSICNCLVEESHIKQLKLQLCGLGLLAYFACEKIPEAVQGFYAGSYNTIIRQTLGTFESDQELIRTCCYIIINVSYVSDPEDYRIVARDRALRELLEDVAAKIPRKAVQLKDLCITTAKLFADRKDPDPKKFEPLVTWDFPLELTDWKKNPYPNGVQDLPMDVRKALREGSRAKIVHDAKVRYPFWWRSSQDLALFQWKTTDEADVPYNYHVPITRIRGITRGLATPFLESAASKDRKLDARVCLVIFGPPTEDSPNGVELNLKLKSRKERDQLWSLLCDWRDAAAYGF